MAAEGRAGARRSFAPPLLADTAPTAPIVKHRNGTIFALCSLPSAGQGERERTYQAREGDYPVVKPGGPLSPIVSSNIRTRT